MSDPTVPVGATGTNVSACIEGPDDPFVRDQNAGSQRVLGRRKRLIVCCDGTWNDGVNSKNPLTNVSRISRLITTTDGRNGERIAQVVYYHTGIGSGKAWFGSDMIEGSSGRGISIHVREAYSFICHNFSDSKDEIILIGFSRGAFAVRAVAAFIEDVGLLTKSGLESLGELYRLWKEEPPSSQNPKPVTFPSPVKALLQVLTKRHEVRRGIRIKVCAVWDTVGSLGIPLPDPLPQGLFGVLSHVNSRLCENVDVAIQALALNERRKHFQATVWKANPHLKDQILKQCWFLGSHSDVGGGNEHKSLSNISLIWMLAQLDKHVDINFAALLDFTASLSRGKTNVLKKDPTLEPPQFVGKRPKINNGYLEGKGRVKNSMKGLFAFAGARPRKPAQYFFTSKGLERCSKDPDASLRSPPSLARNSDDLEDEEEEEEERLEDLKEKIHFTVRVMLGKKLETCAALNKYEATVNDSTVNWRLYHKDGTPTGIQLREEAFNLVEHRLFERWIEARAEAGGSRADDVYPPMLEPESLWKRLLDLLAEGRKPSIAYTSNYLSKARERTRKQPPNRT